MADVLNNDLKAQRIKPHLTMAAALNNDPKAWKIVMLKLHLTFG